MSSTNQLLQDINAANGESLQFNEEEINKALAKDALAYKGLGIKILSIAGGLLAASFFLSFIFMLASGSETALIIIGVIAISAAVYVDHKGNNTILDAACISTYLAGFAMLGYGASDAIHNDNALPIIFMIIALITLISTSGFMLNFISTLVIVSCLMVLISIHNVYQLTTFITGIVAILYTFISIYEARLLSSGPKLNIRYSPLRYGLLFSFVAMLFYHTMDMLPSKYMGNEWISSVMIICAFLFVLHHLIGFLNINTVPTRILLYSMSLVVLAPAIYAPAICGSILIIAVSFHTGHRTGLLTGCIALIYFVGQYYYSLHYTLLEKSAIMFGTGILFLAAWFVLKKQLKRYEQN